MSRVIEVLVSPKGESTVQTKGFSGSSCLEASKWLEQALGTVSSDQKTSEFFQTTTTDQHVRQQ